MAWGISKDASKIEKIKSEMADYLNGLNSTGEISYNIYSVTFDFAMKLLEEAYELGTKTGFRSAYVEVLPEFLEDFTTPYLHGVVIDEDETHIWINNLMNRYPKNMIKIKYL